MPKPPVYPLDQDDPGNWPDSLALLEEPPPAKPYVPEPEPTCRACGGPMRFMAEGKWGAWWSCRAYPRCRGSMKDVDWRKTLATPTLF